MTAGHGMNLPGEIGWQLGKEELSLYAANRLQSRIPTH